MKFFIACTATAVIGSAWLLSIAAGRINSLERRLNTQGETIDTITRILEAVNESQKLDVDLWKLVTKNPDLVKMPDAPPLRWVKAGGGYVTLQFWTEKDGWQYIPKAYETK